MKLIEGRDRFVDLSKGWQQFVLGVVLFYFAYGVMLGGSLFSAFGAIELSQTSGFAFFTQSFVVSLTYCIGAVFFITMFIKHLNSASENDLGFVLCLLSGTLLLVAFGSLYGLAPIVSGVLQGNSLSDLFDSIGPITSSVFKIFLSIAFYAVSGFLLGRYGNKVNGGNTSFKGILALLILPMAVLAALFTFGTVFEEIATPILSSIDFNAGEIISSIFLLAVFTGISLKLFFVFAKEPEREKILSFTILSLRIAMGAFGVLFFLSLVSFSLLLLIDFEHTEILKIASVIALWTVKAGFYGGMIFAIFRLKNLAKQFPSSGISIQFKQQAPTPVRQAPRSIIPANPKTKVGSSSVNELLIEKMVSAMEPHKARYSKEELAAEFKQGGYSPEVINEILKRLGY